MADETAVRVMYLLRERHETLATAESLTGGLLGQLITAVPGSSSMYVGGAITYATESKQKLLGVTDETLEKHGVISGECASEMAAGALAAFDSTWAVSITGVAGPEPQDDAPIGKVFVGVAGPRSCVRELQLEGDRNDIRIQSCEQALIALIETVNAEWVHPD